MRAASDAGKSYPLVLIDAQMPDMDGFALAQQIKESPGLAGATIMMLTSAGQRGDAARCRELGIAVYLIKPIRQSELLEAILLALGRPSQQGERPTVLTRHSLREARRKLRVLVAEDNAVNQQLAVRLLEKQGHTVAVAGNGREALEALEKAASGFDVVLMDVQMPEMDGFEATAAIRQKEKEMGRHIPIIAMTAHAMKGDRELCLDKGMDDYISKPVQAKELQEAMDRQLGKVAPPQEVFNEKMLLDRLDGDKELFREILQTFLQDAPLQIEKLKQALEEGDLSQTEKQAHSLKGAAMNIGGIALQAVAFDLEVSGKNRDLNQARPLIQKLNKEFKSLQKALTSLVL
jgi:CheY-like chemotaxis protein